MGLSYIRPIMWVVGQRVFAQLEPELGLGAISQIVGPRFIEVSFAAVQITRRYSKQAAPLRRLVLGPGQTIRSKGGKTLTIKEAKEIEGLYLYTSDQNDTVWEYELDSIVEDDAPLMRFLVGQWAHPKAFTLREKAGQLRAKCLEPELRGLVGPRVSLLPHQLNIASEIARRPFPRVLLSDEVGLGKTIEAGLIFSSLRSLGRADRVLILVPEALERQWLAEMYRRFHEMFTLVDEDQSQQEQLSQGQSTFQMNQKIICSLSFLQENADLLEKATEVEWDLIIVDEAHRLEWSKENPSIAWEMVRLLSLHTRGLLLLTATPQRQGIETQFGLLHLVDPDRFSDISRFTTQIKKMRSVADLAARIQNEERTEALTKDLKALFSNDKELMEAVASYYRGDSKEGLLHRLVDRHGTGRVLIRNRRSRIQGFPDRKLVLFPLEMSQAWKEWLAKISPENLKESHLFALASGMEGMPPKAPLKDWFQGRALCLKSLLESLKGEKVLLICSHAAHVRALQLWLRSETTVRTAIFDETLETLERDRQAAWFALPQPDGAQVLLSSEIGGEGRNFQFCHHLFLFDLPLHPDVLEQRIGRLDRIGQAEEVRIYVPFLKDSPEEVLSRWYAEGLSAFARPWNGADLGSAIQNKLQETIRDFLPRSSLYAKRSDKLRSFLKMTDQEVETLREEQQKSVDLLIDINSFDPVRGTALANRITAQDKERELPAFLDSAFDYFGVESEVLDNQGTLKISVHSMTLVETFPGISQVGELVATFDRNLALAREELTFLNLESAITQGALSLILEGGVGKISAGIWENTLPEKEPYLFELLYQLQAIAPAYLEVERDLPVTQIKLLITPSGKILTSQREISDMELKPISNQRALAILEDIRDSLGKTFETAAEHARTRACTKISTATRHRKERLEQERARLRHLAQINPLITEEELKAHEVLQNEGLKALSESEPRLDAIRLLVSES